MENTIKTLIKVNQEKRQTLIDISNQEDISKELKIKSEYGIRLITGFIRDLNQLRVEQNHKTN